MGKHMLIACAVGDLQWLKLCVDKGGDPTFINHEGWSALHMAAMNAKLNCIQFLIDNLKIDPDISSETGWTPLHLASRAKPEPAALDCVNYLIDKGADPNKVNDMGISSIHQAVSSNNLLCLSSLVKNGARVSCTDKRGLQPIDVAKVWGHSECSKYLENVMWYEKKREEEFSRRQWVLEHKRLLDEEIRKYAEAKKSDKVAQAYKSWIDKKQLSSPKLPSHSEARARPLTCFKEEIIHEVHRKQLSRKIQDQQRVTLTTSKPRQFSPRLQMERVRKIQELRNTITSRDIMGQPRNVVPIKPSTRPSSVRNDVIKSSRDVITRPRDVTLEPSKTLAPATGPVPRIVETPAVSDKAVPGVKLSVTKSAQYQHQYRIAKLAQPKQPCSRGRKRRKKKKHLETDQDNQDPLYYPVRIDNYFSPASSSTPDSGFAESPVLSPDPPSPTPLKVQDELNKLEIVSLHSEDSSLRPPPPPEQFTPTKSENKTVRFSENVFYDNEHDSVSFGNTFDQLRSCIKVTKKPIAC